MTDLQPRLLVDHPVATLFMAATVLMVLRFGGVRFGRLMPGFKNSNQSREETK